jgi:hypothetical protein
MLSKGNVLALLLVLSAVLVVGCEKEYKMTFFNGTDQPRDLILAGPGTGTGYLGTLGPMGKVQTKIKVDEDFLPARYEWEAGDKEGSFTLTKDSKNKLMIAIEEDGSTGLIDENTQIHKHRQVEVQDVVIDQGFVVE